MADHVALSCFYHISTWLKTHHKTGNQFMEHDKRYCRFEKGGKTCIKRLFDVCCPVFLFLPSFFLVSSSISSYIETRWGVSLNNMWEIGINKSVKPYILSCYYACCFPDTHITLGCSSLCFALISTKGIKILSALCPCGKDKKHRTKATLGYRHSGLFDEDFFYFEDEGKGAVQYWGADHSEVG